MDHSRKAKRERECVCACVRESRESSVLTRYRGLNGLVSILSGHCIVPETWTQTVHLSFDFFFSGFYRHSDQSILMNYRTKIWNRANDIYIYEYLKKRFSNASHGRCPIVLDYYLVPQYTVEQATH